MKALDVGGMVCLLGVQGKENIYSENIIYSENKEKVD